ncbi:TatD family deoxyribonuclease [bacterium]|nr:MAG: TatD family deoxyribonuclease [bacterium]
MLIDTHAHLDFPDFDGDRDSLINRLPEDGIEAVISVGSSLKGSAASLGLAKKYSSVYASVGVHPHEAKEIDTDTFSKIKELAGSERVVAIGEVGLDFYRLLSPAEAQKEAFVKFIELALSSRLPLIIHSRQAEQETIEILKENTKGNLRGVVHCFSGSRDFLKDCLDLGLYISFTCNITYKKSDTLRELVKLVPFDRMLVETDCPYLAPEGMRGERNEPANVKILAQIIARLRGCAVEEVASETCGNAKTLFGIGS